MKKCKYQGKCYRDYSSWRYGLGSKMFICKYDKSEHYEEVKCYRRCKNHKPTLSWRIFKKWL